MHEPLFNMSLDFTSFVLLFSRLSEMEEDISTNRAYYYSKLSWYQVKRQDTKSIDKRSWDLIKHLLWLKLYTAKGQIRLIFKL